MVCITFYREKIGLKSSVLFDPADQYFPVKFCSGFWFGAIIPEIVAALEQQGPLFHQIDIKVVLEGTDQGRTERMALFSKSEQIDVFLGFRGVDNTEIPVLFFNFKNPDIVGQILIEVREQLFRIQRFIDKKLKR